jgi:hypothetical protein
VRQRHLHDLGAELLEAAQGLLERRLDAGLVALALQLGDDTDPQSLDPVLQAAQDVPDRLGQQVESRWSWPAIAVCTSAQSSTVRAIGPAWSSDEANATIP